MTTKHIDELAARLGDGSDFSSLSDIRKWAENNQLEYTWWCNEIYGRDGYDYEDGNYVIISPLDWNSSYRVAIHWCGDFVEKDITIRRISMTLEEEILDFKGNDKYPLFNVLRRWAEVNELEYLWKPSGHPAGADNFIAVFPRTFRPTYLVFIRKNGEKAEITAI